MLARTARILKLLAQLVAVSALTFLAVRTYDAYRSAPLAPWHTFTPEEMVAEELDRADWAAYLDREQLLFEQVRTEVTDRLAPQERILSNRYFEGSPLYPGRFVRDWNRSYVLEPEGEPRGAVVLLHGLTDSPYSLRHIGRHYRESGYVVIGIRLPGHGTVPAGLTNVQWEDWSAATRLAVREAVRRIGSSAPLQLVGFSNGGALAMKYVLDAVEDPSLRQANRVILITPMIGITEMARFAGFAGLPAIFPAFASAAWLGVIPEFNPFKYNSFPVNGARQSSLLTRALQPRIARYARQERLDELPPIITFQSVVDFTVSTRAIVTSLYAQLPDNGSELVLFDINRNTKFGPLIRPGTETALERLLPPTPRPFKATVIANADPDSGDVVERVIDAGRRGADQGVGIDLSARGLLAFARRAAVSDRRFALRSGAERERGFRCPPRGTGHPRRARGPGDEPGLAGAPVLESLLPLSDRAHRRRDRRCAARRNRRGGRSTERR
jgi:alpha-beta hydrolase superfamily lysophospholipase